MFQIRLAQPKDCKAIFDLVFELAVFEKGADKVVNSPEQLLADGFGERPLFICLVAEQDDKVIGISLCYIRYSTWIGKCLYLEDLLVTEHERKKGFGKMLLDATIEYGRSNGFKRINWQVLDWNEPAIEFYKRSGAEIDSEWLNAWIDL